MELPGQLKLKAESFSDGKNGYAQQVRINEEYGIRLTATREHHKAPWVDVFTAGGLPGQEFKTYPDLVEAMKPVKESKLDTSEIERLFKEIDEADKKRAESMPDETAAIKQMFEAYLRLKELGWKEPMYCPKDGTVFNVIESGSTGIHECRYDGEWPTGSWWLLGEDDIYPSRPILFKPKAALKVLEAK